jgi:hypothetical protein
MIDDEFNLQEIENKEKIATLKNFTTHRGQNNLLTMFNYFKGTAHKKNANAYQIEKIVNSNDTTYVSISVYNLNETEMNSNLNLYPRNKVYVFGDIDKNGKTRNVKFNEVKTELKPLEYLMNENKINEETSIGIGGLLGAKLWINGEENRMSSFFSLVGFGVGPQLNNNQGMGLTFNTGRINIVPFDFGQFLTKIFKSPNPLPTPRAGAGGGGWSSRSH